MSWRWKISLLMVFVYAFVVGCMYLNLSDAPARPETQHDVPTFQPSEPAIAPETTSAPHIAHSVDTSTAVPVETTAPEAPVQASEPVIPASPEVSVGSMHRCWVEDAKPVCVGQEYHGELGRDVVLPPIVDVQAGDARTCALDVHGDVWCWGWKLGYGDDYGKIEDAYTPVKVNLPGKATILEVGLGQECAVVSVAAGSEIWCWGFGYSQEYGFALPYYAAPDQPVKMWVGRHVHEMEGGHRWMKAHVGFDDGACGWIQWGQEGSNTANPVINRPERI